MMNNLQINMVGGGTPQASGVNASIQINMSFMDILGHLFMWLIIIVITLGIGLFFYPYALANFTINRVYLVNSSGARIGKMQSNLDLASQFGHVLIWLIISVITLGLGYLFYIYKVWGIALSKATIVAS